jgi:suppressor for copper-sensitivity B
MAKIEVQADRAAYGPGGTARLAVVMDIEAGWHTNSHQPTFDYLIPTEVNLDLPEGWSAAELSYPEGSLQEFEFVDQPISVYDGKAVILATLQVPEGAAGETTITARVRYQACTDSQCLAPVTSTGSVTLTLGSEGAATHEALFAAGAVSGGGHGKEDAGQGPGPAAGSLPPGGGASLWTILLLGVVGGLILNVMPCVLPVLSLKVFSLVKSAGIGRGEVVRGALLTSFGILASFWFLAGAAVVARAAGNAVGWGVQFQEPGFVTFLAVVVILFSLNMWGLFEVPLPTALANKLAGSGPREGAAGHFASGLFATLMATPCSAPFLGTAVSFALVQPAINVVAVFTAIGLGMALPYLLLAAAPRTAELLPKPGAWMETLRGLMGFLLAAAAVWLFFVLAQQISAASLAFIQLALLGLALFLWLGHRAPNPSGTLKATAALGTLAMAVIAIALAVTATAVTPGEIGGEGGRIAWQEFDRDRAEALAADGQRVFVDVTAAWCLTCKVNEQRVLEDPEVATAFERHDVVPMKADWTNYDEDIRQFLAAYGRSGIPFYLLYRPDEEPYVFGELLSKTRVLTVLEESAAESTRRARLE